MFTLDTRHTFTTDDVSANWRDIDCSAYVPSEATGGIFEVYNGVTNNVKIRMRKNGSSDEPSNSYIVIGQRTIQFIAFDANKIVEASVYQGNVGDTKFDLIAYTDPSSVTWLTPTQVGAPLAAGSWQDCDVSSYVPSGTVGVILRCVNEDANPRYIGVRKNGSSIVNTNFKQPGGTTYHQIVGIDANRIVELYKEWQTSCQVFLLGYLSSGWTANTDYSDVSPTSGSWQDVDLTAQTGGARTAILHYVNMTATSYIGACRKNGSSEDYIAYQKVPATFTQTLVISLDSDDTFEAYTEDPGLDVCYLGDLAVIPMTGSKNAHAEGYGAETTSADVHVQSDIANLISNIDAFTGGQGTETVYVPGHTDGVDLLEASQPVVAVGPDIWWPSMWWHGRWWHRRWWHRYWWPGTSLIAYVRGFVAGTKGVEETLSAVSVGRGEIVGSILANVRGLTGCQYLMVSYAKGLTATTSSVLARACAQSVATASVVAFLRGRTDEKHAIMVVADPLTNVVVGDNQLAAQFPWDCRLVSVHAAVDVPSTGGPVVVNLRDGHGRDLLIQPIQVDAGHLGSDTSVAPASIKAEWADLSAWEDVRVDVDAANGAKGLKVVIGVVL